MVYLIECGFVKILYVESLKQYFDIKTHPRYFQAFLSGELNTDQWGGGKVFFGDLSDDYLKLFYLPENNPGAVIASRDHNQASPKIYNKYLFNAII